MDLDFNTMVGQSDLRIDQKTRVIRLLSEMTKFRMISAQTMLDYLKVLAENF